MHVCMLSLERDIGNGRCDRFCADFLESLALARQKMKESHAALKEAATHLFHKGMLESIACDDSGSKRCTREQ